MPSTKHSAQQKTEFVSNKRPIFYLIAILLPFLLLCIVEFGLRLVGFGHQYPLFIESTYSQEYLQPNPDVVKRFFHQAELAPPVGPDTFLFKKVKTPGTLRIVLMGGSTAAGFPYGRFGSPAGMLNQRVKALYPEQHIEIISVAMASINSYALLDFVDEVINIEPDAVLIYAGHNEFLGVMGVGSIYAANGSHAANLLFLNLKDLRLFQLLQTIYYGVFKASSNVDHSDGSRTVMASVAKEKAIEFNSALFQLGKQQFASNLQTIRNAFVAEGIPLYLSSIASNEQDLAPFSSKNNRDIDLLLDSSKSRSNRRIIQQGTQLIENGNYSADLAYRVAEAMVVEKDARAKDYFMLARDFDLLRFRAPSVFNSIIIEQVNDEERVFWVDSENAIRLDSQSGIIGSQHMLEHLHPTPRGYFLISDAFLQVLINTHLLQAHRNQQHTNTTQTPETTEQAWQNMPLSEIDRIVGDYKIATLTADYPFTDIKKETPTLLANTAIQNLAKRRADGEAWISTQQELLVLLQQQNNIPEAAKAAGVLHDAIPDQSDAARVASLLYLQINQLGLAEHYARRALLIEKQKNQINANYFLTLAEILFKSGAVAESIQLLDELLVLEPSNSRALAIKQQISQ